jgi:hypothetical protein
MSRWRFRQWWYDEGPINSHRPRYLYPAYAARRNRICCGLTACQPRRLQWVMLMNPSFSNAPISNLLEATRSTELRLARNHAVLSFCVGAPPMASLNTLSVMRHRHLCPCLSTMPKAIPSNSISNPSFKRDKGISCSSSGSVVTIAESSPSWLATRHASAGRALRRSGCSARGLNAVGEGAALTDIALQPVSSKPKSTLLGNRISRAETKGRNGLGDSRTPVQRQNLARQLRQFGANRRVPGNLRYNENAW